MGPMGRARGALACDDPLAPALISAPIHYAASNLLWGGLDLG
jgi:hypothetical protein